MHNPPVTVFWVGRVGSAPRKVAGALGEARELNFVKTSGIIEARKAAGKNPPALIFSEPALPDGEAGDLAAAFSETPLILVTDDPAGAGSRRALERGALYCEHPDALDVATVRHALAWAVRFREILGAKAAAEQTLRQKEYILDQVTQNTGVGLAVISRDFRTLWANEKVTDLFGPVLGQRCHEAFNRREEVCPGCGVHQVFETGQALVVNEQKGSDVRGDPVWSQVIAVPLLDDRGEVSAAMELRVPIDDRKRAEEAIRQGETRYRRLSQEFNAVLDAIPDNLTLQSPELRILWANRGASENLGRAGGDLVGRHCYEVWQCRGEPCDSCPVRRCFATGEPAMECVVTPDERAWELRAVPIRQDGGDVTAVVEVGREITVYRRAELDRERLIRRLENKNAELEDFTHTVSHDLKTPLTTIRGFASLLLRELDEGRVDRVRAYGQKIASAGERMQELLEELLDLSRAGRLAGPLAPVPLEGVVHEALANLAGLTSQKGVRVRVAPGLPVVQGDRGRLREVIENLVGNSVKFLGQQPHPRVEIGTRPGPTGPVFFVRDNGIGIGPEDRQRIFGLFRKLDPGTEGTGVGLAIVKRIVEGHGGAVWVESDGLGCDSTFCFTLGEMGGERRERGDA